MILSFTKRVLTSQPQLLKQVLVPSRWRSTYVNKRLTIQNFGEPKTVLKLDQNSVKGPNNDEVLVQMLLSSMNPADINTIQGTYPIKPELPGVPGHEGVGKIVEVGEEVKTLKPGDLVIPDVENFGSWEKYKIVKADKLMKVPSNIPLTEVCGMSSNTSTAYRLLKDFVTLQPGDFVIQNGANSAAGQNVIQLCKAWDLKSINVVRNRSNIDELKEYLMKLGADFVLTEEELRTSDIFAANSPRPKLALNCVGGKSAIEILRKLAQRGTMVTYGGMSKEPVVAPTSLLIFKDVSIRGFWMTRWTRENRNSEERKKMFDELFQLILDCKVVAPATMKIPIEDYLKAIAVMTDPRGLGGKKFLIDTSL